MILTKIRFKASPDTRVLNIRPVLCAISQLVRDYVICFRHVHCYAQRPYSHVLNSRHIKHRQSTISGPLTGIPPLSSNTALANSNQKLGYSFQNSIFFIRHPARISHWGDVRRRRRSRRSENGKHCSSKHFVLCFAQFFCCFLDLTQKKYIPSSFFIRLRRKYPTL